MKNFDLLAEKEKEHGAYDKVSERFVNMTDAALGGVEGGKLSKQQQTAVCMICMKLARIAEGDSNLIDHWSDIRGYATLVERTLHDRKVTVLEDAPNNKQ